MATISRKQQAKELYKKHRETYPWYDKNTDSIFAEWFLDFAKREDIPVNTEEYHFWLLKRDLNNLVNAMATHHKYNEIKQSL